MFSDLPSLSSTQGILLLFLCVADYLKLPSVFLHTVLSPFLFYSQCQFLGPLVSDLSLHLPNQGECLCLWWCPLDLMLLYNYDLAVFPLSSVPSWLTALGWAPICFCSWQWAPNLHRKRSFLSPSYIAGVGCGVLEHLILPTNIILWPLGNP